MTATTDEVPTVVEIDGAVAAVRPQASRSTA